jgi:hypothetical protein
VLPADRARPDPHHDEAQHGHRACGDERGQPVRVTAGAHDRDGDQGGGGQLARQPQQQEQVRVPGHVRGDRPQRLRAAQAQPLEFGRAGRRDAGDGGVGHGEHAGQHDQRTGHDDERGLTHGRTCRRDYGRGSF